MFDKRNCMILIVLLTLLIAMPMAALAKGNVKFPLTGTLVVAGNEINPGDCELRWKSDNPETEVTFINNKKIVATVQGKIVNVDTAYRDDSLVTIPDSSGRAVLKEVRIQGKKFKIVFE